MFGALFGPGSKQWSLIMFGAEKDFLFKNSWPLALLSIFPLPSQLPTFVHQISMSDVRNQQWRISISAKCRNLHFKAVVWRLLPFWTGAGIATLASLLSSTLAMLSCKTTRKSDTRFEKEVLDLWAPN